MNTTIVNTTQVFVHPSFFIGSVIRNSSTMTTNELPHWSGAYELHKWSGAYELHKWSGACVLGLMDCITIILCPDINISIL